MRGRRVLWFLPVPILVGMLGVVVSMLAFMPGDAHAGFMVDGLPDLSQHQIPQDVPITDPAHERRPDAYWLVRDGDEWVALVNRDPIWGNGLYHQDTPPIFWSNRGNWDRLGLLTGGLSPRNLDWFAASGDAAGHVVVDLSTIHVGGEAPVYVLEDFLNALRRRDAEAAWSLVYPDRRTPAVHELFVQAVKEGAAVRDYQIDRQRSVAEWQESLGAQTWDRVMELTLSWKPTWEQQRVHLAPGPDGRWWILWSPTSAIE